MNLEDLPITGFMVHIPDSEYKRIWYMAPIFEVYLVLKEVQGT